MQHCSPSSRVQMKTIVIDKRMAAAMRMTWPTRAAKGTEGAARPCNLPVRYRRRCELPCPSYMLTFRGQRAQLPPRRRYSPRGRQGTRRRKAGRRAIGPSSVVESEFRIIRDTTVVLHRRQIERGVV